MISYPEIVLDRPITIIYKNNITENIGKISYPYIKMREDIKIDHSDKFIFDHPRMEFDDKIYYKEKDTLYESNRDGITCKKIICDIESHYKIYEIKIYINVENIFIIKQHKTRVLIKRINKKNNEITDSSDISVKPVILYNNTIILFTFTSTNTDIKLYNLDTGNCHYYINTKDYEQRENFIIMKHSFYHKIINVYDTINDTRLNYSLEQYDKFKTLCTSCVKINNTFDNNYITLIAPLIKFYNISILGFINNIEDNQLFELNTINLISSYNISKDVARIIVSYF